MDKRFNKLCETYDSFINQFTSFQKEFKNEIKQGKYQTSKSEVIDSDEEITETLIITKKQ